jgi:chaperonin cofactor prefoldin
MPEPAVTDLDLRLEFLEHKVEALERAAEKLAQQHPARESGLRRTLRSSYGLGLVRR